MHLSILESRVDGYLPVSPETLGIPEIQRSKESDDIYIFNTSVAYLNPLGQHREGRNARQADLNANIESCGGRLHYPMDVTSMDYDQTQEIIDFTNRVWGTEKCIEELTPYKPNQYLILIAGYSRREGLLAYAKKYNIDNFDMPGLCIYRKVSGVEDFLDIQLRENIHSAPPPERTARGYAEAFLYKKSTTPKLTQAQFCREKGIKAGALSDALLYGDLPPDIRELTDSGKLPFSVAIELGKALPWVKKQAEQSVSLNGLEGNAKIKETEERVKLELYRFISLYNGKYKRHITNTKHFIRNHVNAIKAQFSEALEPEDFSMVLFDVSQFDKDSQVIKTEVARLLEELAGERGVSVRMLHNTTTQLLELFGLEIDESLEQHAVGIGRHVLMQAVEKVNR